MPTYQSKCPGSYGEIIQGMLENGQAFFVNLPIDAYTTAELTPTDTPIQVMPSDKHKVKKCLQHLEKYLQRPLQGYLRISSDLPVGKGLSSSTADMVAALTCVDKAYGLHLSQGVYYTVIQQVEPLDGGLYDTCVAYSHQPPYVLEQLGTMDTHTILSFDRGGMLDTLAYHQKAFTFTPKEKKYYTQLYQQLKTSFQNRDWSGIGKIATQSTLLQQARNPKPFLSQLLEWSQQIHAVGLVNTHTGTCIGILLPTAHYSSHILDSMPKALQPYYTHSYTTLSNPNPS